MDDLNARIAQQNAQRQRELQRAAADFLSPPPPPLCGHGAAPPLSSPLRRACSSFSASHDAPHHTGEPLNHYPHHAAPEYHHQQQHQYAPSPPQQQPHHHNYPYGQQSVQPYYDGYGDEGAADYGMADLSLQEDALTAEEAELDQLLEEERRLASGSQRRGRGVGAPGRGAGRGRGGPGAVPVRNPSRAKIPMLDSQSGGSTHHAAPTQAQLRRHGSGLGRGSERVAGSPSVAPSVGYAPSIAGRRSASSRDVHFTNDMYKPERMFRGQAAEMLGTDTGNIREKMRRAGVEPRDHLKEERERLKLIAQARNEAQMEAGAVQELRKHKEEALRSRSRANAQARLAEMGVSDYDAGYGEGDGGDRGGRRTTRKPAAEMAREAAESRAAAAVPARHKSGAVPAYLQRRKAEWAEEAEAEAARAAHAAECPPGLRIVGDEEKAAILAKLDDERKKTEVSSSCDLSLIHI